MGNRKKFKRKLIAASISAASISIAQPGFTQEFTLEEVMVTATRRAQSAEDIPYNISATTAETLERAGITDFTKLARSTPGLTFIESGPRDSGINNGLIIRGLNISTSGSTDLTSLAAPTVSTYVGETPLFVNLHLKDIERVEVLRGPQGTLYGSGSLGGTIRYIPQKPDFEEFSVEVGSRLGNTKHASGLNSDSYAVINVPISEKLAFRTAFGYAESQGFVDQKSLATFNDAGHVVAADGSDPVADGNFSNWYLGPENTTKYLPAMQTKGDVNDSDISHMRASLAWDATENLDFLLTYQYQKDNVEGRQAVNEANDEFGGDLAYAAFVLEPMEREVNLLALDVEADLGFASLSANVSGYSNESEIISDQTGIYVNGDYWDTAYYANVPIDVVYGDYENEDSGTVAELRLVSNGDGPLDYVVGVFWLDQEFETLQQDVIPGVYEALSDFFSSTVSQPDGFLRDETFHQEVKLDYEDKALFGELTYRLSDEWQITAGARFFEQKIGITNDLYLLGCGSYCAADGVDPLGFTGSSSKKTIRDQIFKINTSYDISDGIMGYFTWSEGFRHGGANAIVTAPASPLFDNPEFSDYDPDLATNWELGFKGRALDDRMRFTVAAFQIDWEEMQLFTFSDGSGVPVVVNAEEARTRGLELDTTYYFTPQFSASVGFTYTDAELTEDFNVADTLFGYSGDTLPGVPEYAGSLRLNYFQSLSNGMEIAYFLNAAYIDDVTTDINKLAPNYTVSESNTIVDVSATLEASNWSITVFVDNLTDERALGNGRSPNFFSVFPYNNGTALSGYQNNGFFLQQNIARPLTAGLGFKYRF